MAQRTFTHLYDSHEEAARTVSALESAGIPHSDISIVSNNVDNRHAGAATTAGTGTQEGTAAGTGASAGTLVGGGIGLVTGIGLLAIPGVGPVVAAGWLIATLSGAGIGAAGGGILGSLVHHGVPEEHAHAYSEGVRRGGSLVTVRGDETQAARIEAVLDGRRVAAVDVDARRAEYQSTGWERFEETAPHYSPEQISEERNRRGTVIRPD